MCVNPAPLKSLKKILFFYTTGLAVKCLKWYFCFYPPNSVEILEFLDDFEMYRWLSNKIFVVDKFWIYPLQSLSEASKTFEGRNNLIFQSFRQI